MVAPDGVGCCHTPTLVLPLGNTRWYGWVMEKTTGTQTGAATGTPQKPRKRANRDHRAGSDEYLKFMKRLMRMYGRRIKEGQLDIDSLTQLKDIQAELDEQTREVVMSLRGQGYSWTAIGGALGMNRASAYKKYLGNVEGAVDAPGAQKAGGVPSSSR